MKKEYMQPQVEVMDIDCESNVLIQASPKSTPLFEDEEVDEENFKWQ